MSGSVNKVVLIGHLGRDPDVRRLNNGSAVVSFSLATSESWRDKATGERKERTEWHQIVIFNEGLGKIAEQYAKKGSKVYVEGRLATREYQDRAGNARKTTEIVLENFRGELQLLGDSGRTPPDPDSYGQTRTRGDGDTGRDISQDRQRKQNQPLDDPRQAMGSFPIDDDIPF